MIELENLKKVSVIIDFRDEKELIAESIELLKQITNCKLLGINIYKPNRESILDISLRGLGIAWSSDLIISESFELDKYPIVFVLSPSQLLLYFKDLQGDNYDSIFIGCLMLEKLGIIKRIVK